MNSLRWTQSDYRAALEKLGPIKRAKYGNKKTTSFGVVFDSAKEARRFQTLTTLQMAGTITDLFRQMPFDLIVNGQQICYYVADFTYQQNGKLIVEDVKSKPTRAKADYAIKKKLMKACYNIEIVEV